MELIVVMFIISLLAFFTIPLFKAPDQGGEKDEARTLARFISSVKHQAEREQRSYQLHLDLVSGRAWAGPGENQESINPDRINTGEALQPEPWPNVNIQGLSLFRVEFADPRELPPEDTVIRVSPRGISDMALIHMDTEDGEMTLKLEPFIPEVEIIQGSVTFNDCR